MSSNGYDVPRVTVSMDNDMKLKPAGKICAPLGIPRLPGGLLRSHSHPAIPLASPGSWLETQRYRDSDRGRRHRDGLMNSSFNAATLSRGLWADATGDLRPSTVAAPTPGGGRTQGVHPSMTCPSLSRASTAPTYFDYDSSKHGWHTPQGQAAMNHFAEPAEPGSWAWTMRKAGDHVGYRQDGGIAKGDAQVTAVSGDTPQWMVGPRTVPGPYGTHKVPVRRSCVVQIDDTKPRHKGGQMRLRARTFAQGPCLSTIFSVQEDMTVPIAEKKMKKWKPGDGPNPAQGWSLKHGGCIADKQILPRSNHKFNETYAHDQGKAPVRKYPIQKYDPYC